MKQRNDGSLCGQLNKTLPNAFRSKNVNTLQEMAAIVSSEHSYLIKL